MNSAKISRIIDRITCGVIIWGILYLAFMMISSCDSRLAQHEAQQQTTGYVQGGRR